jgi:sec-independent protein translocase protein TatA
MMGDLAKGIKSFKKGLADDEANPATPASPPQQVTQQAAPQAAPTADQAPR